MIPFKYVGYCDESEDETSLVMTCVFARVVDWISIVPPWQNLLKEFEIPEFHAEHCENRRGHWETWSDPGERWAAGGKFLKIISENPLPFPAVYSAGVDLKSFQEIAAPRIRSSHPGQNLDEPWFLAFHQVLDDMLRAQSLTNDSLGSQWNLDLILDEKSDFRGRVSRRVEELKATTTDPLSDVTFANSVSAVGIQMADLIAYEMRKALSVIILNDEAHGIRNQWKQLMDAKMPGGQRRIYATFWDEAAMRRGNLPPGLL